MYVLKRLSFKNYNSFILSAKFADLGDFTFQRLIFPTSDEIGDLLKVIVQENDRLQSFKCELEKILNHTTQILSSLSAIYKQRKEEVTLQGERWHRQIDIAVKKLHE